MIYVYQYRIYPTPSQKLELNDWLRIGQYWYNRQLGERFDWWELNRCAANSCAMTCSIAPLRDRPGYYEQKKQLPGLKKDYQFTQGTKELLDLSRVPSTAMQSITKQVDDALARFTVGDKNGKRSGRPRFKNKARFRTLTFTGVQKGEFLETGHFGAYKITAGLGSIKVRMHRPIPDGSVIKRSSITKKVDGWYLNVTLDDPSVPEPPKVKPTWENAMGLDAVLKDGDYVATSTGVKLPSVKALRRNEKRLAKVSRAKSKAQKATRRRRKLARREARVHQRIALQRKQHRYETAHELVNSGKQVFFVEDLNLVGLKKRNKAKVGDDGEYLPNGQAAKSGLNKSWSDAGFGLFIDALSAVAAKAGAQVVKVNAAYTSKFLSYRNEIVFDDVSVREYWDAVWCVRVDRDINAALNILQRGLQVFPLPKKASKRETLRVNRKLDNSTVTAMVATLKEAAKPTL